jgi:hypothetical protein
MMAHFNCHSSDRLLSHFAYSLATMPVAMRKLYNSVKLSGSNCDRFSTRRNGRLEQRLIKSFSSRSTAGQFPGIGAAEGTEGARQAVGGVKIKLPLVSIPVGQDDLVAGGVV